MESTTGATLTDGCINALKSPFISSSLSEIAGNGGRPLATAAYRLVVVCRSIRHLVMNWTADKPVPVCKSAKNNSKSASG